jgi:hypothetical protein
MNKRLQHDTAFAMAKRLRDVMGDCIREDDRLDALEAFYRVCVAGMESYELGREQRKPRFNPQLM